MEFHFKASPPSQRRTFPKIPSKSTFHQLSSFKLCFWSLGILSFPDLLLVSSPASRKNSQQDGMGNFGIAGHSCNFYHNIPFFPPVDWVIPCQNCQTHAQFLYSYLFLSSGLPFTEPKIPFSQHSFLPGPCFSNPKFGCILGIYIQKIKSNRETEAGLGTSQESLQPGTHSMSRNPWIWLIHGFGSSRISLEICPSSISHPPLPMDSFFLLNFRFGSCSFILSSFFCCCSSVGSQDFPLNPSQVPFPSPGAKSGNILQLGGCILAPAPC